MPPGGPELTYHAPDALRAVAQLCNVTKLLTQDTSSCLSGCFRKLPDVVVSDGGRAPLSRRAYGLVTPRLTEIPVQPEVGPEAAPRPSKIGSIATQTCPHIRGLPGKHYPLWFAETTG